MKRWYWVTLKDFKDIRFLVSADSTRSAMDQIAFPAQTCSISAATLESIDDAIGAESPSRRVSTAVSTGDLIWNKDGKTVVLKQPR